MHPVFQAIKDELEEMINLDRLPDMPVPTEEIEELVRVVAEEELARMPDDGDADTYTQCIQLIGLKVAMICLLSKKADGPTIAISAEEVTELMASLLRQQVSTLTIVVN